LHRHARTFLSFIIHYFPAVKQNKKHKIKTKKNRDVFQQKRMQ